MQHVHSLPLAVVRMAGVVILKLFGTARQHVLDCRFQCTVSILVRLEGTAAAEAAAFDFGVGHDCLLLHLWPPAIPPATTMAGTYCISTRADVVSPKYKLAGEPYDIHSMSS